MRKTDEAIKVVRRLSDASLACSAEDQVKDSIRLAKALLLKLLRRTEPLNPTRHNLYIRFREAWSSAGLLIRMGSASKKDLNTLASGLRHCVSETEPYFSLKLFPGDVVKISDLDDDAEGDSDVFMYALQRERDRATYLVFESSGEARWFGGNEISGPLYGDSQKFVATGEIDLEVRLDWERDNLPNTISRL